MRFMLRPIYPRGENTIISWTEDLEGEWVPVVAYISPPQTLRCGPPVGSAGAPNVKRAKNCVCVFFSEMDSVRLTEDAISCLCCETGDSVL